MHNLKVIHVPKGRDINFELSKVLNPEQWLAFKTCMREIYISSSEPENVKSQIAPFTPNGLEYFQDGNAYSFLLQVITGLKSEIVGETEIFGQFKHFVEQSEAQQGSEWFFFKNIAHNLIVDCKKIREQYLKNLGQRSYGSLVRKHLGDQENVVLLGGGLLTKDILPYVISPVRKVEVLVRSLKRVEDLIEKYPTPQYRELCKVSNLDKPYTLIVAAPIENHELALMLGNWGKPQMVMDLRDLETPGLEIGCPWMGLKDLFDEIQEQNLRTEKIVTEAKRKIDAIVCARLESVTLRPYGWEDVCA